MKQPRKAKSDYTPYQTALGVLLAASGIKYEHVADRVDLSPSYLSAIANGTRLPSEAALSRIAAFLGVTRPLVLLKPVESSADLCALRAYYGV